MNQANKLNYIYNYSSLDNVDLLDSDKNKKLIQEKLDESVVTRSDKYTLSQNILDHFFKLFMAENKHLGNNVLQFETYILRPSFIKNEFGKDYVFSSMTVYENNVIEFNMFSSNKLFSLHEDMQFALNKTNIDYYNYSTNKYNSKHDTDLMIENIGHFLLTSFATKIYNLPAKELYNEEVFDLSEYKVIQSNNSLSDIQQVEKISKLTHSPIDPRNKLDSIDESKIMRLHTLVHYSGPNTALIFTYDDFDDIALSKHSISKYHGLYLAYATSLKPVLIDRHISSMILNFYRYRTSIDKSTYLIFKNYIHKLRVMKNKYMNPVYKTVLTLISDLEHSIQPYREKELVNKQLKDMQEYYELNLTVQESKTNTRIQNLLLFLSLLTALSIIVDLPLSNGLKIILGLLLVIILIAYLKW